MKEIKINFDPKVFQQVGRAPVFNEKNASTCTHTVVIPFDKKCEPKRKSIPSIKCVNPHGDYCGCSRPNAGDLLERLMVGFEERHKVADPALIKAICRHQPVKLPRELYEMDIQTVQTVELKLN